MIGRASADVTAHVTKTITRTHVEFRARNRGAPLRLTLNEGAMEQARLHLDKGLLALKEALPALRVQDNDLAEVFDMLHRLGRRLIFMLFGPNQRVLKDLMEFWNWALPFARNPSTPGLIHCVGDRMVFLPLEYLPLFDLSPDKVRDSVDFVQACRNLVGFSCVVQRSMLPIPIRSTSAIMAGRSGLVPMRYLYNENLEGAKDELAWFLSAATEHVEIEGPYPCAERGAPNLAQQIFDPRLLLTGGHREMPDQIQHFACHCYATLKDPLGNEIELSGGGQELRVTLGEIGEDLVAMAVGSAGRAFELPLVFMNACGAARMHASSALSFPYFFLEHGNRGFIGSEIEVPDDLAAAFSRALYERLLIRGMPLGQSMLDARNHLLYEHRNPLGIVYSAYADPELRVRAATRGVRDVAAAV